MRYAFFAIVVLIALAGCTITPAGYSDGYAAPTYVSPAPVYVAPPSAGIGVGVERDGGYRGDGYGHDEWRR